MLENAVASGAVPNVAAIAADREGIVYYWAGGHGLHSTPRDYLKFQRALLGGGERDGVRILKEETVEAAFSNQIGDLDFPPEIPAGDATVTCDFNVGPGFKFGFGLLINTEDVPGARRAGSAPGRACSTALLGRPHGRADGGDLHPAPALRASRGLPGVRRLRGRAVGVALT